MSNSPLVSYTKISPNKSSPRNHKIDTVTIHCVVGQCSVETLGNVFAPTSRQASSNYGTGLHRCTALMYGLSEGFSRAERSYKQIYFSGGFYYGNYHNERDPRL